MTATLPSMGLREPYFPSFAQYPLKIGLRPGKLTVGVAKMPFRRTVDRLCVSHRVGAARRGEKYWSALELRWRRRSAIGVECVGDGVGGDI